MKSLNVCREKWAHEPGSRFRSHPLRRGDLFGASSLMSASTLMSLCAAGRRARWTRSTARLVSHVEDGEEMPGTTGEWQRRKQNDHLNWNENSLYFFMRQESNSASNVLDLQWCVPDLIKRFPRYVYRESREAWWGKGNTIIWLFCLDLLLFDSERNNRYIIIAKRGQGAECHHDDVCISGHLNWVYSTSSLRSGSAHSGTKTMCL